MDVSLCYGERRAEPLVHFLLNKDKARADWQRIPSSYVGAPLIEPGWWPEALVGALAALEIQEAEAPDQLPWWGGGECGCIWGPCLRIKVPRRETKSGVGRSPQ